MSEIVTKLTVDSGGAVINLKEFADAMSATADKTASSVARMTTGPGSVDQAAKTWQKLQATTDPVFAAQTAQQSAVEKAFKTSNAAVAAGLATHEQAAAQVQKVSDKYGAMVSAAQNAAFSQSTLGKALSPVNAQLTALAAGGGAVSVFLSSLGPIGIAAAVAWGTVSAAIHYVEEESLRMGQGAIGLKQFTEVTGLATNQIGALKAAGAEFGLTGDDVSTSMTRLTAGLTEARRASGTLYDDVRTVNGGLALQLQQTTTTKGGIDALAKAWAAAGDESQKASIAKAAFGKGGAGNGPLLGAIADAGGVDQLAASMNKLNVISKDQIDSWAKMAAQIDETNKRAKNILAAIFTTEGLQAQLAAAQYMERMAKAAADLAKQKDGLSWFQQLMADIAANEVSAAGGDPSGIERATADLAARARIAQGNGSTLAVDSKDTDSWVKFGDAVRGVKAPIDNVADSLSKLRNDAAADAKIQSERISLLGSASTADDKLVARLAQLKSAFLDNRMGVDDYNKAINAASIDTFTQKLQAEIGALGSAATVAERFVLKIQQLNAQRDKGEISPDTYLRGAAAASQDEYIQKLQATNAALGSLATPAQQYELEVAKLAQQLAQGVISQDTFNRGLIAASPLFKDLDNAAQTFGNSLVQAFVQGKHGLDALAPALTGLSNQMTEIGTKSIANSLKGALTGGGLSLDPASIGIGLVGAAIGYFTGQAQKKQQEAAQQQADMLAASQRAAQYNTTAQLAGIDTTNLSGALQAFDIQAVQSRLQEAAQKYPQMAALESQLAAQRLAIYKQFNDAVLSQAKEIRDFANSLQTGDLSPLTPEQKLAAAQATYNADYTAATGTDADAASKAAGVITNDANAFLQMAKDFYASSSDYSTVYDTVFNQLSAYQGVQYKATGGVVTGGVPGVDSVPAMLTPNEFVVNEAAARRNMPLLEAINAGVAVRGFANGGSVGSRSFSAPVVSRSANDNGDIVAAVSRLNRTMVGTATAQIETMRSEISALRGAVNKLTDTTRVEASRAKLPGRKAA